MHLLNLDDDGKPVLTRFLAGNIPKYAILSHTWEADDQEVTFQDLTDGIRFNKLGYRKIRFCGEQARTDNLQYFWVDSCCIDKSSSAELQEAINSMFRWYRNADKCYIYLSDVSTGKHSRLSELLWESAFVQSRWFTRGWTLQELLAPSSVEFFSREGRLLGNKKSLEVQIHHVTGIPVQALQDNSLSKFSVDERMSWAAKRKTTIEEDQAYCLLGIFDTYLPLIYGEGKENAFRRLRKELCGFDDALSILPYAAESPFNSNYRQHDQTCLPNTRIDLLRDISKWADGQDERFIFWLNGLAGTGKSTIARTVARRYFNQKRLGASFFFSRGGGDIDHAGKFVTSIALQLASSIPALDQQICDAIVERRDIISQSLSDQWQQLVLRPLLKLDGIGHQCSYLLVVDALDECNNYNNIRIIIQLLAEARSLNKVRLRVFLTSRPEIPIRYGFGQMPDAHYEDFVLHNISPSIVDQDISAFFEYNLRRIREENFLDACWPGEENVRHLIQMAGGLFIWAATACRFIHEGKRFAAKRLDTILQGSGQALTAPEKHLDKIYTTVLKQSVTPEYTEEEKQEAYYMLRKSLGSIIVLFSPLSASSLSRLLGIRNAIIDQVLNDLHSVLDVPKEQNLPFRLHHPSFRDYLLSKDRCRDPDFCVDEKEAHQRLTDRCIQLMSTCLKQNVLSVDTPGTLVSDFDRSQVRRSLPPEVQYACLYWIQHLERSGSQFYDNGPVHYFLQEHLLHWLEALGWMGKVSEGFYAITSLESLASFNNCPDLLNFIHDAKRFILYSRPAIEQAPLQTYSSALIFSPTKSIIREKFNNCIPNWIRRLPKVEEKWNEVLQTLEDDTFSLAFSPDGKILASASNKLVRLWDAGSGAELRTLEGHSHYLLAVIFSADGKKLASASHDKTVKLWSTRSGAVLQTLIAHTSSVRGVAFSPNGKILASASDDRTVRLWDTNSGTELHMLDSHSGSINAIAFAPDDKLLASASNDGTIKLWDTDSGAELHTLDGHCMDSHGKAWTSSVDKTVHAVAFSPDGKMLASGSRTIKLWDSNSWEELQTIDEDGHYLTFSPDGQMLASALGTVHLWDAHLGVKLQTLDACSDLVSAIAFSPDGKTLALAWDNKMVELRRVGLGAQLQTLDSLPRWVSFVTFSPNGKLLASVSPYGPVKLWDSVSGAILRTFEGAFDYPDVMFSPDSKTLAISNWNTVTIYDTRFGAMLQVLKGHYDRVSTMAFSPDSRTLASASNDQMWASTSDDGVIKLWDTESGALLWTFKGHLRTVETIIFSPDGELLASSSIDTTVRLWDVESGVAWHTFKGHSGWGSTIAFSQDSKILASALGPERAPQSINLWDVSSGATLQTFNGHSKGITAIALTSDNKILASASVDRTVKLWDVSSGLELQLLNVEAIVGTLSFSNDNASLQTGLGLLPISSSICNSRTITFQPQDLNSIFIMGGWLSRFPDRILWLPPEYRTAAAAVYGNTISFGLTSGRVTFMECIWQGY